MENKQYKVCSIFDTETCNFGEYDKTQAYCILYIANDLREIDLNNYIIEQSDNIKFFRFDYDYLNYIDDLINYGINNNIIPIVCAYNLMFDLQTIIYNLGKKYKILVNAQSSTNCYTLDLCDDNENQLLRFWDTFHLEMNGLEAMGNTCGIEKAKGSWNYDLIRSPYTELTEEELFYAKRDVQVIPVYLNYLLKANRFLTADMFGFKVITKTSIVRQMAFYEIGSLHVYKENQKRVSLLKLYEYLCNSELPKTYKQYALRKACFRGGLTFTSANYAQQVFHNVASLDVTSMHHAFICGRYVPQKFRLINDKSVLNDIVNYIINIPLIEILENYHKPFMVAGHFKLKFKNIKLKKNTCFEKWGISILSQAKFMYKSTYDVYEGNELNERAEQEIKNNNYIDEAFNFIFGFGKLMKAEWITVHVNEIELWLINQVYDFDELIVCEGEATRKFIIPPDFVTLQSSMLFELKNDLKNILKTYNEGEPYKLHISKNIPDNIAKNLKTGSLSKDFLNSYYNSTIKGMFNGIYGTQAQDIFKPKFKFENSEITVDENTVTCANNFDISDKNHVKVLYTYGMRIVAGSRLHLIISMILLYNKLNSKIDILGGDTDSLKIRCDNDVNANILLKALEPLHKSVTNAIYYSTSRIRNNFNRFYSKLNNVGCYEVENANDFYINHIEYWNKARISQHSNKKIDIVCAGLPQPPNVYNVNSFMQDLLKKYKFEKIAPLIIGFNVFIKPDLCNYLQRIKPKYNEMIEIDIIDYKGKKYHIRQFKAISLYLTGRWIGESSKMVNNDSINYLKSKNINIITNERYLELINNKPQITIFKDGEYEKIK